MAGCLVHRIDIEPRRPAKGRPGQKGIQDVAFEERIDVEAGTGVEARVPVVGNDRTTHDRDLGTANAIESVAHPDRVDVIGNCRATHDLSEGVHAGIGTTGDVRVGIETEDAPKGVLELALDGT